MNEANFDEMSTEELADMISFENFRLSKMQRIVGHKEITLTETISMIGEMIERLKKIQSLCIEIERRKNCLCVN